MFADKDCDKLLEDVGCREPEGMDLRHFKLMVLHQDAPLSPMPPRIELEDNDFGGNGERREPASLHRTPSLFHADLHRSISMVKPAFRMQLVTAAA